MLERFKEQLEMISIVYQENTTAAGSLDLAKFSGARELSDAFAAVAEQLNPSVVTIFVEPEVAGRPLNGGDLPDGDFFGGEFFEGFSGIKSAKGRSGVGLSWYEDFIQTNAAINPGNSGGALVNPHGELIAIDVKMDILGSIAQTSSEGESSCEDLGFSLTDFDEGVARQFNLPEDKQGVVITDIAPGSIADRTGLRAGDVVLKVDRESVVSVGDNQGIIDDAGPGDNTLLFSSGVTLIYSSLVKCRRTS
jgi:S1-C subfamily serine protease